MPGHYNAGPRDEKMPSVTREGKKKKNNQLSKKNISTDDAFKKAQMKQWKAQHKADALRGLSETVGHLRQPPPAAIVSEGIQQGKISREFFDEYDTEKAAGSK
tara:strand:- start:289 stop:597 length:309 start_codon:yes stop_codon:yes gene_type:complete